MVALKIAIWNTAYHYSILIGHNVFAFFYMWLSYSRLEVSQVNLGSPPFPL